MRWPWQRDDPSPAPPTATSDPSRPSSPSPIPPAGWAFLPPLQRQVSDAAPATLSSGFVASLPTRVVPGSLGTMGHLVDGAAPSGTVAGSSSGFGAPVQRSVVADLTLRPPLSGPAGGSRTGAARATQPADASSPAEPRPAEPSPVAADAPGVDLPVQRLAEQDAVPAAPAESVEAPDVAFDAEPHDEPAPPAADEISDAASTEDAPVGDPAPATAPALGGSSPIGTMEPASDGASDSTVTAVAAADVPVLRLSSAPLSVQRIERVPTPVGLPASDAPSVDPPHGGVPVPSAARSSESGRTPTGPTLAGRPAAGMSEAVPRRYGLGAPLPSGMPAGGALPLQRAATPNAEVPAIGEALAATPAVSEPAQASASTVVDGPAPTVRSVLGATGSGALVQRRTDEAMPALDQPVPSPFQPIAAPRTTVPLIAQRALAPALAPVSSPTARTRPPVVQAIALAPTPFSSPADPGSAGAGSRASAAAAPGAARAVQRTTRGAPPTSAGAAAGTTAGSPSGAATTSGAPAAAGTPDAPPSDPHRGWLQRLFAPGPSRAPVTQLADPVDPGEEPGLGEAAGRREAPGAASEAGAHEPEPEPEPELGAAPEPVSAGNSSAALPVVARVASAPSGLASSSAVRFPAALTPVRTAPGSTGSTGALGVTTNPTTTATTSMVLQRSVDRLASDGQPSATAMPVLITPARPASPSPMPVAAPVPSAPAVVQRAEAVDAPTAEPPPPSDAGPAPSDGPAGNGTAAASVTAPPAAGGAASVDASSPEAIEKLAQRLYGPLVRRLKAELLLDRERRGIRIDGI